VFFRSGLNIYIYINLIIRCFRPLVYSLFPICLKIFSLWIGLELIEGCPDIHLHLG